MDGGGRHVTAGEHRPAIDPGLPDEALLDLVQRQTLAYFWDFGHPVSGLARERSNPDPGYDYLETVCTGGSGFGIMAMLAGAAQIEECPAAGTHASLATAALPR